MRVLDGVGADSVGVQGFHLEVDVAGAVVEAAPDAGLRVGIAGMEGNGVGVAGGMGEVSRAGGAEALGEPEGDLGSGEG